MIFFRGRSPASVITQHACCYILGLVASCVFSGGGISIFAESCGWQGSELSLRYAIATPTSSSESFGPRILPPVGV
jgi:hypothetical protein